MSEVVHGCPCDEHQGVFGDASFLEAFEKILFLASHSLGQYIPLCDEAGYYKPTQYHGPFPLVSKLATLHL